VLLLLSILAVALLGISSEQNPAIMTIVTLIISITVISLWLTASFFIPFLMVNFAQEECFKAGFAFAKVTSMVKTQFGSFLTCWLIIIGINLAALVLPILTLIGIFLIPTTIFIAQVVSCALAAQAWHLDNP
jgi:uncharacterized membrane protein